MEIKNINYHSNNDDWESNNFFGHTASSELHIPRKGDHIRNFYGNLYKVVDVMWVYPNTVNIECERV